MLIQGVEVLDLEPQRDHRGTLTTLYKRSDFSMLDLPQWNLVRSDGGVLRGMHAHLNYDEYYVPLKGAMFFALADLRPDSPTYRETMTLSWAGEDQVLVVPSGVAHGVYCDSPWILACGLSSEYDGEGEYGCRFDDPELAIRWPNKSPVLSSRDESSPSYSTLIRTYAEALGFSVV